MILDKGLLSLAHNRNSGDTASCFVCNLVDLCVCARLHASSKYFFFECALGLIDVYLIGRSRDIAEGSTDINSGSFCLCFTTLKRSEAERRMEAEGWWIQLDSFVKHRSLRCGCRNISKYHMWEIRCEKASLANQLVVVSLSQLRFSCID